MGRKKFQLDVLYIVRPQVERWTIEELEANSNLESARKELERRLGNEREGKGADTGGA